MPDRPRGSARDTTCPLLQCNVSFPPDHGVARLRALVHESMIALISRSAILVAVSLTIVSRTADEKAFRAPSSLKNVFLNDLGSSSCTPACNRPLLQMLPGALPFMW